MISLVTRAQNINSASIDHQCLSDCITTNEFQFGNMRECSFFSDKMPWLMTHVHKLCGFIRVAMYTM